MFISRPRMVAVSVPITLIVGLFASNAGAGSSPDAACIIAKAKAFVKCYAATVTCWSKDAQDLLKGGLGTDIDACKNGGIASCLLAVDSADAKYGAVCTAAGAGVGDSGGCDAVSAYAQADLFTLQGGGETLEGAKCDLKKWKQFAKAFASGMKCVEKRRKDDTFDITLCQSTASNKCVIAVAKVTSPNPAACDGGAGDHGACDDAAFSGETLIGTL